MSNMELLFSHIIFIICKAAKLVPTRKGSFENIINSNASILITIEASILSKSARSAMASLNIYKKDYYNRFV